MRKLLLALLLALVGASSSFAQGPAKDGTLAILYDVDSTSLTYCKTDGPITVNQRIKTVGSSTTVTEFVASSLPFTNIVVGDVLVVQTPSITNPNLTTEVAVTAKASGASITVDTAIDLSATGGFLFTYYHHVCGTTSEDGWFAVSAAASRVSITVQYDQGDLGAFVARWECRASGAGKQPVIIYPGGGSNCGGLGFTLATDRCSATAAGVNARLTVTDTAPGYAQCRVGVAFVSTDTSDATTNLEKVTIKYAVR